VSPVEFLPSGEVATWDGTWVIAVDATGGRRQIFLPPAVQYGQVLRLEPGGATLLFGEALGFDLYRIDLATGQGAVLGAIPYLYDLTFRPGGEAFASIGDASWTATTIERLDLGSLTGQIVVDLAGPAGPLCFTSGGDLAYGTNDPAAPSQAVLVWSGAVVSGALASGVPLTEVEATVLASGFPGLSGMSADGGGNLWVTSNDFATGSSELVRVSPAGLATVVATTPAWFHLAAVALGPAGGAVEPFTGPGAGRVASPYGDFATANALAVIEPSDPGGLRFGDCDLDQDLDIVDALLAAQAAVGLQSPGGVSRAQCEVDGSGVLDVTDALQIAQAAVGLPVTLGY
jgi:hypothetical protein